MIMIETFPSQDILAEAASATLAKALGDSPSRTLVVTGGHTPGPTYDRLSQAPLPWRDLTVTLTDERFVDPSSDKSNARLVRERLLVGPAAAARFVPLRARGATPADDAASAEPRLKALLPSAAVLLGMGEDGHIASLFPGTPELASGLDLKATTLVLPIADPGESPFVDRISLSAHALTETGLIVVLITGAEKRGVIERIFAEPDYSPPAATILRQTMAPVRILWAA
jgi:6-phosphogluconolactonase